MLTFIYCRPAALDTEAGCAAVDKALTALARELNLDEGAKLRQGGGNSIIISDVAPEDLWRAMDRAVPDWEDQRLFFAPVFP